MRGPIYLRRFLDNRLIARGKIVAFFVITEDDTTIATITKQKYGRMTGGKLDLPAMVAARESERDTLHMRHLNEQLVRVLRTIGFDVGFKRGQGQYLYDRADQRYLDLLSGFGVFAIGRNHPLLRDALKSVLDNDFANLVQMDVSTLAGILAEQLVD